MDLDTMAGLFTSGDLLRKVPMAMLKSANDIRNEDPGTANHAVRLAMARAIIRDRAPYVPLFMTAIAGLGTITAASSDADLLWAVASVWDDIALTEAT